MQETSLMIIVFVNNKQQLDSRKRIEEKERNTKKTFFSTLMCFNEDALIFLPSLLYTFFLSLSLSLFAVRLTASKYSDVHLYVVWASRKKALPREEKKNRGNELYNA